MSEGHQPRNFLISVIAGLTEFLLTPTWFLLRSHMGIQHTGLIPVIVAGVMNAAFLHWFSEVPNMLHLLNERENDGLDGHVLLIYASLVVLGYIRNERQAAERRRVRDWRVHSWSSGDSLIEPVIWFWTPRIVAFFGNNRVVARLVRLLSSFNLIYYGLEPLGLVIGSGMLWLVGSTFCLCPWVYAFALIVARNDALLQRYLRAHAVADAKIEERNIRLDLEGPSLTQPTFARVPAPPPIRQSTHDSAVFNRLAPELQALIFRDRLQHPPPDGSPNQGASAV